MSSVSGLSEPHREHCRAIVVKGCELLLAHPDEVHYTEGPQRWSAIEQRLLIEKGQVLREGDCSSTATWLLWNALKHTYALEDLVNGLGWRAGYTGTMLEHGKRVRLERDIKHGDLAIYGGPPGKHVAVCVGGGMVMSHGSEAGPYKLPMHYRDDLYEVRRYI